MKRIVLCLLTAFLFFTCTPLRQNRTNPDSAGSLKTWKLIFEDDFKGKGSFDTTKWTYANRGRVAWNKFITQHPDYVFLDGGSLVLRMNKETRPGDTATYHAGGIQTKGKFSFLFGKVEVRAKFNQGKGAWPAIWMMPEKDIYGGWPASGEIDIMEHVNREGVVHQTIHNAAVTNASGGSTATKTTAYAVDDFNVYSIWWTADSIAFYVNDKQTTTYHRQQNATHREWPFDQPFYLILNQSGGAGWPGLIIDKDLPFRMEVDWVRVYQER
ncbi:glycoside hydrolase family 16 protein [Flavisolibacter sp. BT320]|nr:glycoside hydrolase family 16 protein [Flavisolibacter longurius]